MSTTKLNIGKIPISKGEYQDGTAYQRLNQVTMLGSTYQSKIDDNTSAPAQMGADGAVENINTDKWLCIAVGNVSAARKVVYNNETSGLDAGNVQEAIDEVGSKVNDLKNKKVLLDELPYITNLAENAGSFSFAYQGIETKTVFLNIQDLQGTNFVLYNNTIDSLPTGYKITFYDDSLKYINSFKSITENIECTIPDNACYVSISYSKPEAYIKIDNISKRIIVPNLYNGVSYDSSFFGVSYKNHIDFIAVSKGLINVQNVLYTNSEDGKKQTLSYINGDYENLKSWEQHKGNSQNIHQLSKEEYSSNIFFTFEEPIFGTVKIHRSGTPDTKNWTDGYTCIDEYNNSTLNTGRFNSYTFIAAFCNNLKANKASEADKYLYYKDEDVCKIHSNDSKANILPKELLGFSNPFSLVDGEINTGTFKYRDPLVSYKDFNVINLPVDGDCEYYIGSTDIGFLGYNATFSNRFLVVFQNEERKTIGYIQNTATNNVKFKNGFYGWYIKTPALCKFITFTLYEGIDAYMTNNIKAFVCRKKNLNIAINETLSVSNAPYLAAENITRSSKDIAKKIWVLGDSISSTGYGGYLCSKRGYGSFGGWVKYFCEQVMPEYIANNAKGGFTITDSSNVVFVGDIIKSGTSNSYIAEIEELVKLYTEKKVEAPDYLMLVGCTNDFGKARNNPDGWSQRSVVLKSDLDNNTLNPNGLDYDSFMESKFFSVNSIQIPISKVPMFKIAGAIRYIIQRVGTLFPNCKFIIVTSLQSPDNWVTQKQCHDEMKWVANRLSIPVIDVSGQANTPMLWDMRKEGANTGATIPRRFINDGFHPYGAKDSAGNSFITAGAMYQGLFIAEQFKTLMLHDTAMRKNVVDYTQGDEGNGYPSGN